MKEIEFLRQSVITISKKIEQLEKWCVKHEVEGLEYGNDFENRDKEIIVRIEKLESFLPSGKESIEASTEPA